MDQQLGIEAPKLKPQHESGQESSWSKDFVEHLRTVHFALVIVASVLIMTGTNTESARMTSALTQIQHIAKFERQWPSIPTKLYEEGFLDSQVDTSWSKGLAIVLPKNIYKEREIDTFITLPKSATLAPADWKFGGTHLPTELVSLADFRDFWNLLHNGVVLVLPKPPADNAYCNEDVRIVLLDGSTDLLTGDFFSTPGDDDLTQCVVGAGLMAAIGGPPFPATYKLNPMRDGSKLLGLELWIEANLPLDKASKYRRTRSKALVSITTIQLQTTSSKINEAQLGKLFFNDWRTGKFETAFPELNSVSRGISTLEINDAVRRLESQVASAEKNISLLGFTVPLPQVSQWGILVLLSVQLYLWLHLHEFSAKFISPESDGWNVAWIGIYRSNAATWMATFSCLLLPCAAALILGWRLFSSSLDHPKIMLGIAILVVMLSAMLGISTVHVLKKLLKSSDVPDSRLRPTDSTRLQSP